MWKRKSKCATLTRGRKAESHDFRETIRRRRQWLGKIRIHKRRKWWVHNCRKRYTVELPPLGVVFLTKLTYDVPAEILLTKTALHRKAGVVDTRSEPNVIVENYLKSRWRIQISRLESLNLGPATKKDNRAQGLISLLYKRKTCRFNLELESSENWQWMYYSQRRVSPSTFGVYSGRTGL